jgi:exodeoxyribonuclease VII large subunit
MQAAMTTALNRQIKAARQHLKVLSASPALQSPVGYLNQKKKNLELLQTRLISSQNNMLARKKQAFIGLTSKLDAMSPLKVLTRGYAMAQTEDGQVLRSTQQVQTGDAITVTLSDGKLNATVSGKENAV